jgi:Uma2 family endonuclease
MTMSLPEHTQRTFEEYVSMKQESEKRLEYIDGAIYMAPSPSTLHQRISMKLSAFLFNILDGKECEVIAAPYDIELTNKKSDEKRIVIPDLSIICDKQGFSETKYVGVPEVIIEIISPSIQSHDLIFKTNLYQEAAVKEYWIINPILNHVMVYSLGEDGTYKLIENEKKGTVTSRLIDGFHIDVEELFQ